MNVSGAGLELIAGFEGFRAQAYPDPGSKDGLPVTIGYGSTRWEDGSPIKLGQTISEARAKHLMQRELMEVERVLEGAGVALTQPQFDALSSFIFNVGARAFAESTLLRKLRAGDYQGAANELLRWNKNDGVVMAGLKRRREAERAMFLSGTHPNIHSYPAAQISPKGDKAQISPTGDKPMAPVLAALLPSLVGLIPELSKLFGSGSAVSERNTKIVERVADIVVEATKAPNLQGAVEGMESDPALRQAASNAVQEKWYELVPADGGGIKSAREFNAELHAVPFWMMPAFWISLALLPLLYGTVYYVLTGAPEAFSGELRAAIASSVVTGVLGGVVGFWLGSSFTTSRSRGLNATPQ